MKQSNLRLLTVLLVLLLALAVPAAADTLELPAQLCAIEAEAFCGDMSIDHVELPEGVCSIGSRAFADSSISSIYLPESLTDIAEDAFDGCSGLAATVIPGSYAEEYCIAQDIDCTVLSTPAEFFTYTIGTTVTITGYTGTDTAVYIPEEIDGVSVTAIGRSAFRRNKAIEKVYIPKTVTVIDKEGFEECTGLKHVTFSEGLQAINDYAFSGCTSLQNVNLPTTLISTARASFGNCDSFTEITFHDGFAKLERYTFDGCDNLVKVNLPDTVTDIGERAFKDCVSLKEFDYPLGWVNIPRSSSSYNVFQNCQSLKEITVPEGMTAMPKGAFSGANCLEKINLPSTLETLPEECFRACGALKEANLPEGLTVIGENAFYDCFSLPNPEMPTTLVTVGPGAFTGCDSFTEITFHEGLITLSRYAFDHCDKLQKVTLPDTVIDIGERAFKDCVSMTSFDYPLGWANVPRISSSYNVFQNCQSLKEITVPEGVTATPVGAFAGSAFIEKVNLPSTLLNLGDFAFHGCVALSEIELNEGLTRLGQYAFNGCTVLPNLQMPTTLEFVGYVCFANCDSFTEITFHDGLLTLSEGAFSGCDKLVRVDLPDSVTALGARAFEYCPSLTSFDYPKSWNDIPAGWVYAQVLRGSPNVKEIVVPEGVEYMPKWVFWGCDSIEKVTLPSTLKELPDNAFQDCVSLTECDVPNGVTLIRGGAFQNCGALRDIYISPSVQQFATSYPVGGTPYWNNVFANCSSELIIESEYGAKAIEFARQFSIHYYYLSYTGRNVPKGTVYKGDPFNITGFVRSTLPLTDVTATVCDSDGNIVRQVQVAPGVTDYSLAGYISEEMDIGSLPLGKYTFALMASTEKSTETFVRTGFTVAPPPLRVYLRGYKPFSGFMNVDSDAVIEGIVSANYDMTSLAVQFIPSEGGSTVEFKAVPGVKSFDLSTLNIGVNALVPDAYEMRIVVQGNGETKIVGTRSFSLTTDAVPEGFTVDLDLLNTFLGDAENRELFSEYQVDYTMRIEETMTEEERFNLVMSQREDYSNASIRDTIEEMLAGVDDKDTYLIELYKKEIADFIVDMGEEASAYQYDSAMHQAIADSLVQQKKIDIDFIGSEYGAISEYDALILEGMGKVIDKVSDTTGFVDTINDLSEVVGNFYKDYSRGIEIMDYLAVQYVGNEQYQYALEELKCEYFSNSYRAFNDVFTYAYKKAVENMTDAVVKVVANALSAGLYEVYEVVGFAEKVLDEVYDIYGDSNDYVTYAVQCETYQNARAAYRDVFDLVKQDPSVVENVAKLKRSFEITRLSAIRALETLMNMKSYSCIDYTYPMMDLKELKTLTIGF
ncbi:MAG: leucine-rich repeat protein [Clostridia bacterium]|nr:leucine-rich repeat protein [Clostridia bacterium]